MPEIQDEPSSSTSTTTTSSASTSYGGPWRSRKLLFEKYEMGRLLGCGAFAKVYYARDARTGQSVAMKVVSKRRVETTQLEAQIKREVSIMSRLRHPHIIRLLEVLATKSKIYFVMEFAKGGELFGKVAKGRFSEDLSRRYFHQLISAVNYCHSRGVYHRDLKPENILLDDHWNLKISDFGLAAVKEQIRPDDGGLLHTLCGTPAYVAPEILAKKGYDGAKVDIWSCGVILYVLTAGYLPFNDANVMNLYRKIYRGEFKCPRWMSSDLKKLLSRLLDTNPCTRITIDEILHDPWFRKGYKEIRLNNFKEREDQMDEGRGESLRYLNAFDLISFSPGFSLSGLFMEAERAEKSSRETFLSAEEPETVVEKVEEAARRIDSPRVEVGRTEGGMGVIVEGHHGNFGVVVEAHRLTEELAVVDVRKREKDVGPSHDFWKNKLMPRICHLFYQPGQQSSLPGPST